MLSCKADDKAKMAVSISHDDISDYYRRKLKRTGDLKTTACSAAKSPHPVLRKLLDKIPSDVSAQFYGCGSPVPLGIENRRVRLKASYAYRSFENTKFPWCLSNLT